jgi:hypothetical protein
MKDVYRRFNVYGRADPVSEMLLKPVSKWQQRSASLIPVLPGPFVGLTRFPISDDLR